MGDSGRINVKTMKNRLVNVREEVFQLVGTAEEAAKPVELDQTKVGRLSRMDALQVQAMAAESGRRREVELQRIDAALKRIEEKEYGYCTACGEKIPIKRLEFDPAAPLCVDCAGGGT